MFSLLRNRFGIPGVISVIALVFAMFSGAYAASNYDKGKAMSSAAKAKKGPRGPRGPQGVAGPAGPSGPAGPAGAKGDTGAQGNEGKQGPEGKQGKEGKSGFTKALPPGETETGTWAFLNMRSETQLIGFTSISFNVPLAAELAPTQVHYINPANKEVVEPGVEVTSTACLGSVLEPIAAPGNLCIYAGGQNGYTTTNQLIAKPNDAPGASTSGAILKFFNAEPQAEGKGSWAVAAEEQ
jgi:hypothetical protein